MTTFTIQDLTPAQQEAVKQHEAMHAAHQVLNTRSINNLPNTPEEDEAMKELFEKMGQDLTQPTVTKEKWMEHGMNNPISASAIEYTHGGTLGAPVPQPSAEVLHNPDLSTIIDTICTQLQLLSTVISQSKAQPEAGENSLQECVSTTLEQADWFTDMVKDEFERRVESEVETYFERRFSPEDHFDFGDAISNEVDDRLDDVVRDRLDDVVQEQLEEVVAEKLKSIRVVFD